MLVVVSIVPVQGTLNLNRYIGVRIDSIHLLQNLADLLVFTNRELV